MWSMSGSRIYLELEEKSSVCKIPWSLVNDQSMSNAISLVALYPGSLKDRQT